MKSLIFASVVSILAAASASAQSTSARVPTGIDVPGPAHYTLVDNRVVVRREACDSRAILRNLPGCAQSTGEAIASPETTATSDGTPSASPK